MTLISACVSSISSSSWTIFNLLSENKGTCYDCIVSTYVDQKVGFTLKGVGAVQNKDAFKLRERLESLLNAAHNEH